MRVLFVLATIALVALVEALPSKQECEAKGEVFRQCGSPTCQPHCDDPEPLCPAVCEPACHCPPHKPIRHNGKCVKYKQCPKIKCANNKVFMECGSSCPAATCDDHEPSDLCTKECVPGCFCKEGDVLNEDGVCVQLTDCPDYPSAVMKCKVKTQKKHWAWKILCKAKKMKNVKSIKTWRMVNGGDDASHPYFKVSKVSESKKFKYMANYPDTYTFETILESKNGKRNKLHYAVKVEKYDNTPECVKKSQNGQKMLDYGVMDYWYPSCKKNGDYEPKQCTGMTNMCYCVDEDGNEIYATRYPAQMHELDCRRPVGPCREKVYEMFYQNNDLHSGNWLIPPVMAIDIDGKFVQYSPVPACDKNGFYEKKQNYKDGKEFCVDRATGDERKC